MQLFYQPGIPEGIRFLDPEESRHCVKVLRKKTNQSIDIVDGRGIYYRALITESNPKQTVFDIIDQRIETVPAVQIHLAVAPTKRLERIEWLVEKVTELGVQRISLVQCDNSERVKLRLDRLTRKAVSAMKQSLKASLPVVEGIIPLTDFIKSADPMGNKLLAHLDEKAIPLTKAVTQDTKNCILIGPEGDFSKNEIERAKNAGFSMVSMGASRLRTETAALAAVIAVHSVSW